MKRQGFTWIEAVIVLVILFILAAVLFPILARPGHGPYRASCQSNLKQIGLGIKQYIQDYNEKFPPVRTGNGAYGWADAIQPYLKSTAIYQCLTESTQTTGPNPRAPGYTDYWFNSRLSALKEDKIDAEAMTIMNGDGNDGTDATNARYSYNSLPVAWPNDPNSPARRHLDGMNLLFADGHVKWLLPHKIVASPNNGYSFAIR